MLKTKLNSLLIFLLIIFGAGNSIEIRAEEPKMPDGCRMIADTLWVATAVEELPERAFCGLEEVKVVRFEEGSRLQSIGREAFRDCSNLQQIQFPDSLQTIGPLAFAYCRNLRNLKFPDSLKRIGNNAFSLCQSITEISIPASVTELESYAFSDCISLRRATLPANPSMLGELIFSGCERLELLIELSPTPPPFDCMSFIFEPDDEEAYRRCRLETTAGSAAAYRHAPGWKLFFNIFE